jgi:hypothetical protein
MPSLNTKLASAPNTTANYVLKATTSTTIGNSLIYDNGTGVGINTSTVPVRFTIANADTRIEFDQLNSTTSYLEAINTARSTSNYFSMYTRGLNIWTRPSGTGTYAQTMTITDAGNVGIGTSSPSGILSIIKDGASVYTNTTWGNANSTASLAIGVGGSTVGATFLQNNAYVINNNSSALILGTSDTERMRITSGGDINMNATSGNKLVTVKGQTGNGYYGEVRLGNVDHSAGIVGRHISSGNANLEFWTENYSSGGYTKKMTIEYNGYVSMPSIYNGFTTSSAANMYMFTDGGIYRSTSSLKYKKDVRDYDKGLAEVMAMKPVYYKGKSEKDGDTQFAGLIAEDIHDLGLTEFVQYAEDGTPDALAYQNMIALLTKAIQELKAEVDTLKQLVK